MKDRGHGKAVLASCRPCGVWLSVLPEDLLACGCVGAAATCPLQLGAVEGRAVQCPGVLYSFPLGITATGQCPVVLSAYLEVLVKPKLSFESSLVF